MSDDGAPVGDEGYDEWIAAVDEDEGYFLACPSGHGSLPPRRLCSQCGSEELRQQPLAGTGSVETFTETHVPIPAFGEDAPYVVAIAAFDDVRITGQLRGIDAGSVEAGLEVQVTVGERATTDDPIVVFRPA